VSHERGDLHEQVVTIVLDPDDNLAVQNALRKHCGMGSGRVLISPAPRTHSSDALAGHIFAALDVWDRRGDPPRNEQLLLDGLEPRSPERPEQLETPDGAHTSGALEAAVPRANAAEPQRRCPADVECPHPRAVCPTRASHASQDVGSPGVLRP
jgi:hypothetical protein